MDGRVDHDLDNARGVPQVDKHHTTLIPNAVGPAGQLDGPADIDGRQVTGVRITKPHLLILLERAAIRRSGAAQRALPTRMPAAWP